MSSQFINFGGQVKSYKQAAMTVFVIFATAYVLTILGCSKSNDISGKAPAAPTQPTNPGELNGPSDEEPLVQIDPRDMRECTSDEFATLIDWSNDLNAAKEAVQSAGGKRSESTVKLALNAIQKCDLVEFYHGQKPCKKITRVVTQPDNPTVRAYDAFRIDERCKPVENYLKKFNLRPDPRAANPQPEPPNPGNPPAVDPVPVQPDPAQPVDPGNLSQCSADEFAKLNSWRAALDTANKQISKLGGQSSWKYDSAAVESSKTATALCESLIAYHQARPCKREKVYTSQSLRDQCVTARTYNYNFAQRTESLIVNGARLYLNTSIFADHTSFEPGPSAYSHGQCIISNVASSTINYSGQKVLVTEARVYTDPDYQMFVLQTQEGLKLECYGVNYPSLQTSLTEVMRLLSAKDTRLPLSYELN